MSEAETQEILNDEAKTLQERLRVFRTYRNKHINASIPMLTKGLGLRPAQTDFYLILDSLEDDEVKKLQAFDFGDPVCTMILHCDDEARERIYLKASEIKASSHPFHLIRVIAEGEDNVFDLALSLSSEFLRDRASYLKQSKYKCGTMTASFSGLLMTMASKTPSPKQIYWFIRGVEQDFVGAKRVFFIDSVRNQFPEDYSILIGIIRELDCEN